MRLIDYYRRDLIGLTEKQRRTVRSLWHNAAKRACNLLLITADPLPAPQVRQVPERPGDKLSATYPVYVIPFDPFFLSKSEEELIELYRLTKARPGPTPKR